MIRADPSPAPGIPSPGRQIVGTQALRLAVRLGSAAGLARLVSPEQYGVFGMAAAVFGFAFVVQDLGLATVTVRTPNLDPRERDALFWLNAAIGVSMGLAVGSLGFLASGFFREPRVWPLLGFMSATFVVNGLHTQLRAHLTRELRFTELNRIEIASFTLSSAAALAIAAAGGGAWALASLSVLGEAVTALGVWRAQAWRPGPWPAGTRPLDLLRSGAGFSTYEALRYGQRNCDAFLVGRWFGAPGLGLYGRAVQLAVMPALYIADPLAGLAVSTLRELGGADRRAAALAFWSRMVNGLAWIAMPAAALALTASREGLAFLLGTRWLPAAALLAALAPAIASLPLQAGLAWMLVADGRRRRLIAWSTLNAAAAALACVLGRPGGVAGIAWSVGAANGIGALAGLAFLGRSGPIPPRHALAALVRPVGAAAALAVAVRGLLIAAGPAAGLPLRMGIVAAATALWCIALRFTWPGARSEIAGHFIFGNRGKS